MMTRSQPDFKPGDIIGFSGRSWHSIFINLCSYGIPFWGISHVGIVGEHKGELLLFESTTLSNLPCVIHGEPFKGTQAVRIDERIDSYDGRVWHYPLYRRLYPVEAERLNQFLVDHIGISYDHIGAIRSGGQAWSWFEAWLHEEDLDHIFCSELCAAAHREIGMIRTDNVSRWNPNRFIRLERRESILVKPWRLK
jgi:hypothetical protein